MIRRTDTKAILWAKNKILGIFVFNLVLAIMVLLRAGNYFNPIFSISINVIALTTIIMAIVLLGAGNRAVFSISAVFLVIAGLFQVFKIEIWSERSGIYFFEALVLGIIHLFFDSFKHKLRRL